MIETMRQQWQRRQRLRQRQRRVAAAAAEGAAASAAEGTSASVAEDAPAPAPGAVPWAAVTTEEGKGVTARAGEGRRGLLPISVARAVATEATLCRGTRLWGTGATWGVVTAVAQLAVVVLPVLRDAASGSLRHVNRAFIGTRGK